MTYLENGKATGVLVFAMYSYNCGGISFFFNTSKIIFDGK